MGELYDIAQRHMDAYGVRAAALARRMDMSPQALSSWKTRGVRELPTKASLEALARETRTPYGDVLTAALRDVGYLPPKEREQRGDTAPMTTAGSAPAPAVPAIDDATAARLAQARERWQGDMERALTRRGASAEMVALEQRDVTERFMKRAQQILAVDLGQGWDGLSQEA